MEQSKLAADIQKGIEDCVQYCEKHQNHLSPHIAVRSAVEVWAEKYATLREKYDNILTAESGHENKLPTFWDVAKAFKWAAEYRDEIGGELLLSNGQWVITSEDEDGNENEDKELTPGNVAELYCLQCGFEKETTIDDHTTLRARADRMERALNVIKDAPEPAVNDTREVHLWIQAAKITVREALEQQPDEQPTIPQQGAETMVFVPCEDDDPRCTGGYTSSDGQCLCHVRESQVPVVEGAVWLTGQYDRLYEQLKAEPERKIVCWVDYQWGLRGEPKEILRDICAIMGKVMGFNARGIGYGGADLYIGEENERKEFLEECERLHVQWLDEGQKEANNG